MLNKVTLIGNIGQSPEIRSLGDTRRVATFSLATKETWKDKTTDEKKEDTQWHKVVVFSQGLVRIIENYVKKGSKIYIEGQLQHRKYTDKQGIEKYITEVVLSNYDSKLILLDSKNSSGAENARVEDVSKLETINQEEEFNDIPF